MKPMKTYIVYVNGVEAGMIKAGGQNAAEKKAKAKLGRGDAYMEVWLCVGDESLPIHNPR